MPFRSVRFVASRAFACARCARAAAFDADDTTDRLGLIGDFRGEPSEGAAAVGVCGMLIRLGGSGAENEDIAQAERKR